MPYSKTDFGADITMKIIGKFFRFIIAFMTAAVIITVGSFTAVFFVSKDEPKEIFLLDYALIYETGEDKKLDVWFVKKTNDFDIADGDGIVYYDGAYRSAAAMIGYDGRLMYFDSDDLNMTVTFDEDAAVGKIVAAWQQK